MTRLIEKLAAKNLLYNQVNGRLSLIYVTEKGKSLEAVIQECWYGLQEQYREILGKEGDELSLQLYNVSNRMEKIE